MDINAEVSTQLSLIDVLLSDIDKPITLRPKKNNERKEEETQDAMPDSTTNTEKSNAIPFHCGDDVLVPNKDGRYYLGTIVELSTSNDNDSCEVGTGVARCLVKFGDNTRAWASVSSLKLLSAPPADDGRIMCVVCKRREGPAASPAANAIIACDMCGRGYHAKCHSPPVDSWINGASWHCKRCVDQRYRVAAAENRALKRSDLFRFKGGQQWRQQQELTAPCDTASTTSLTVPEADKGQSEEVHCYCGQKSDWLAQMLLCCRCSRWFHQRCVTTLQYPLYAGDKLYIFACANCNGGVEYLRRLELCWLDLAHLALYNLTAYNAPNYFDLDTVIMPYIMDNWHALQLPEKMWRTPVNERREKILTALTSSRKRFKCGREMKKRATIWGLRLRRPPPPPFQLSALEQIKKGVSLTDEMVKEYAPRLRFLPRPTSSPAATSADDGRLSTQPSSSEKSSYKNHSSEMSVPANRRWLNLMKKCPFKHNSQQMIVPVDGHWLNLMMGKRFHENLNSNCYSENDSTSSYESIKQIENDDQSSSNSVCTSTARQSDTKDDTSSEKFLDPVELDSNVVETHCETPPATALDTSLVPCSINLDKIPKEIINEVNESNTISSITVMANSTRIATMNLEVSKLSTKNIIEHSKIMSLQHMDSLPPYNGSFTQEVESSGDETSSRGTLDAIIPPLKDFQGKNNPFLMQNTSKAPFSSSINGYNKQNVRQNHFHSRFSLPGQLSTMIGSLGRPSKRKLSEKDIIVGPNGEVKRRKYRRPRKYLQGQFNKSCPLPEDPKPVQMPNGETATSAHATVKFHGRRLRQRQEKNYYENARRCNSNSASNNSVKSLQLSPHKVEVATGAAEAHAQELSALKSSVQSYFRAGQTFGVLARRRSPAAPPAYLIQWDA